MSFWRQICSVQISFRAWKRSWGPLVKFLMWNMILWSRLELMLLSNAQFMYSFMSMIVSQGNISATVVVFVVNFIQFALIALYWHLSSFPLVKLLEAISLWCLSIYVHVQFAFNHYANVLLYLPSIKSNIILMTQMYSELICLIFLLYYKLQGSILLIVIEILLKCSWLNAPNLWHLTKLQTNLFWLVVSK